MDNKNEKPNTTASLKREDLNELLEFSYNTAISYLKSKIINRDNLQAITLQLENLSVNCTASIFYTDNSKNIRFAPEHEKVINILENESDIKYYLLETICKKLDELIADKSIFEK